MRLLAIALSTTLFCACKGAPSAGDQAAPAASAGAASAALPASAATQPEPWYVGTWTGEFVAQPRALEPNPKEGAPKEWAKDDGGSFSGKGSVTLHVDRAGVVTGSVEGVLGALIASGVVDGDTLRVQLTPKEAKPDQITTGLLIGEQAAGALKARLSASTGDSLRARGAELELKRTP